MKEQHFRVSNVIIEEAEERIANFESTRHGKAFARKMRECKVGDNTLYSSDLAYLRDRLEAHADYWDVLGGLYSLAYERGQKAERKKRLQDAATSPEA